MTAPLSMIITDAGQDAIVDAANAGTDAVEVTAIGVTATPFIMAPTLTAIPGEIKRLTALSGLVTAPNMIHVTGRDTSSDAYDITGFGLYLEDGTLLAAYSVASGADPVLSKTALATALLAHDIAFTADVAENISFGDAEFSYPAASETIQGVARLSTEALADAGEDDETIMTPALVKRLIAAALGAAALPFDPVYMYHGSIASIPAGYQLCNGTNGTPDLRDKFIVGAGGGYNPAATGGAAAHNHVGTVQGHALTPAQMPAHRHLVAVNGEGSANLTANNSISDVTRVNENQEYDLQSLAGEPTIGRTSETGGGQAHNHGLTIDNAGHLPPYFALAFIMKPQS